MQFQDKIKKLVAEREKQYRKADGTPYIAEIKATFNREKEATDGYNGRQLLELLQNADDAKSTDVLIQLNTQKNTLIIANKCEERESFSIDGIESLLLANLSPKNRKTSSKYIGSKGLGFRSIINWSDKIIINSNNIDIAFSQEIAEKAFSESNLKVTELPILAIPELQENPQNEWTTSILIKYKVNFLDDINKQIEELKPEILLFLNHIQTINIDRNGEITSIEKPDKQWVIYPREGDFSEELLNENDKDIKYQLKLAINTDMNNKGNDYLFSYFPTNIKIDMPFIVHGTFDLDSTRNQLNDTQKNRFVLEKLVDLIIETAQKLTKDSISYKALEFLTKHNRENGILEKLGFFKKIDDAIEKEAIYPCLDGKYRKKSDILYSNNFAQFIQNADFCDLFSYVLIPADENIVLILDKQSLTNFSSFNEQSKDIEKLNLKINKIDDRVDFIRLLIENRFQKKLPLLIDENEELITEDEVYTPSSTEFSLPGYVHIRFVNKILYDRLKVKIDSSSDLVDKLKSITNIKQYNKTEMLRKVITSTNKELEKENVKNINFIQQMIKCLYDNYENDINISNQRIKLIDKNQQLQNASNLYLSKTYPSGELTEELFGDIFADSDFLANIDIFNLVGDKQKIEDFFIWLGINKNTKFFNKDIKKYSSYSKHIKNIKNLENNVFIQEHKQKEITYFDNIKTISKEKFILWCLLGDIKKHIDERTDLSCEGPQGGSRSNIRGVESYVLFQLKSADIFKDYLISDDAKINRLVNDESTDYKHQLFKKYDIHKADIDSLLLKLGAVEQFNELSKNKTTEVLKALPEKDPQGKLAQKIYLESFKQHESYYLDIDISLFAEQSDKSDYFSQDVVYYAGSVKLPKEYTNKLAIFNYPKKAKGVAQNIIKFFGIQDLSIIQPIIKNKTPLCINNEFQTYFKKIKPYILTYRVENLEKKEDEAKKLNKTKIILYQDIICEINNKKYILSDYDYLIDSDSHYLIKVPNKELKNIRGEYYFYTVFGDIIGLVFGLEITDKFRNCIKDSETNIERDIKDHIGNNAINDAKYLLGIASDFYNFWHTIYELKDQIYTDQHNNNLALINQELNLDVKDNHIQYDNLSSVKTVKTIIKIFTKLSIKVTDFNKSLVNTIDLSSYHQQKLEDYFQDKDYRFKQNLYQYCQQKNRRAEFVTKLNKHQAPQDSYATQLEVNYQEVYAKFIKEKFGFDLTVVDDVDIDGIREKNKAEIVDEYLPDEIESLLYFKGGADEVKQWIENKNREENPQVSQPRQPEIQIPLPRKQAEFDEPPKLTKTSIQNRASRYNPKRERDQRRRGEQAEKRVCDSLIKDFGKENVDPASKTNDNLGYDIKYKDKDNKWWYVEVKTRSNNVFYMSKNEKKLAEAHKDEYKIFLVDDEEITVIYPVDLSDKSKFNVIANKFEVYYTLK